MTQRDIAGYLNIDRTTLYNWKKNKPNLYKILMQGFEVEEVKKLLKESLEKLENIETSDKKRSNI